MKFSSIIFIAVALVPLAESSFSLRGGNKTSPTNAYVVKLKNIEEEFKRDSISDKGSVDFSFGSELLPTMDEPKSRFSLMIRTVEDDQRNRSRSPSPTLPEDNEIKSTPKNAGNSEKLSPRNSTPRFPRIKKLVDSLSRKNSSSISSEDSLANSKDSISDNSVIDVFDLNLLAAPIDWNENSFHPEIGLTLTEAQERIIQKYVTKFPEISTGNYDRNYNDFKAKVLKTLGYIRDNYSMNGFVVNLASIMVYIYDNRAPNALRYFMDSTFSFFSNKQWDDSKINRHISSALSRLVPDLYHGRLANNENFKSHVYYLLLDVAPGKYELRNLMKMYTEIFDQTLDYNDFISRYATILKILMEITEEKKRNEEDLSDLKCEDIEFTLKKRSELFEFTNRAVQRFRSRII